MIESRNFANRVFDVLNTILQILFALSVILPFVYIIFVSLTNQTSVSYFFKPTTEYSLLAYKSAVSTKLGRAFIVSVVRTVAGTGANMLFTSLMAYVISRRGMPGGRAITFVMVFTMLFGAGLIPSYLLTVNILHLKNSYAVYILPGLISAYNCVLLRNGFQQVPNAVLESVRIDGGSDWRILFSIMMPLSLPTMATVALFYAVSHWNAWFDAILYMSDTSKYTMQVVLRAVSYNTQIAQEMGAAVSDTMLGQQLTPEAVINATLVLTTIPIVCVYPFLQKYFIKGITLGAVKE